jgi:hypothetical protein
MIHGFLKMLVPVFDQYSEFRERIKRKESRVISPHKHTPISRLIRELQSFSLRCPTLSHSRANTTRTTSVFVQFLRQENPKALNELFASSPSLFGFGTILVIHHVAKSPPRENVDTGCPAASEPDRYNWSFVHNSAAFHTVRCSHPKCS